MLQLNRAWRTKGGRVVLVFLALALSWGGWRKGTPAAAGISPTPQPPAQSPDKAGIIVLESNARRLILEIVSPNPERQALPPGEGPGELVSLAGYGRLQTPGFPELPQKGLLIALPPGAEPAVSLLGSESEQIRPILVAPSPQTTLLSGGQTDLTQVPAFSHARPFNELFYRQNQPYPATVAELTGISWLRQQRLARLAIYPLQYNPAEQSLTWTRRLRLQVDFRYPEGPVEAAAPVPAESPPFEAILSQAIVNYDQARTWQQPRPASVTPAASPCLDDNAFRLTLSQSGIYGVSYASLQAAGLPAGVNTSSLRLCHNEQELAVQVDDPNSNGLFDSGDSLIFYGEAIKTQETTTNVYWLTYGGASGLRMAQVAGNPGGAAIPSSYAKTVHLEQDLEYYSRIPNADLTDHWFWSTVLRTDQASQSSFDIPFTVSNLSPTPHTVTVTVKVWGWINDETHTYQVLLNGNDLGSQSFTCSGIGPGPGDPDPCDPFDLFTAQVDSTMLSGSNTLTVKALQNQSAENLDHFMLVDWAEVGYRRLLSTTTNRLAFTQQDAGTWRFEATGFTAAAAIYDVTDPAHPVAISSNSSGPGTVAFQRTLSAPASYALTSATARLTPLSIVKDTPSNLASTAQQADYLIITDPVFDDALAPLVSHRTSQGYKVSVAYVQDIFDEFSYGLYDPEAIRAFLEYSFESWQSPAPTYVLLAGEGSYDHRNLLGLNGDGGNRVPVYLLSGIDSNLGEAAADNRYVAFGDLEHPETDSLADMLLGRLPARNSAELTVMVNKILAYESGGPDPAWRGSHLFLVDNGYKPPIGDPNGECTRDPAADFFQHANTFLANHFPASRQFANLLYYAPPECYPRDGYPAYMPYYAGSIPEMTIRFLEQFNQGQQFMSYVGHSSQTQYSDQGGIVNLGTVNAMQNGSRTPISLPMTCLVGQYDLPQFDSLEEAMLKRSSGGTVASYAPTGFQVQTSHDFLLEGFYQAVFDDGVPTIGQAVFGAKEDLYANGPAEFQDLQDTFMLLGDPAMVFNLCQNCTHQFVPLAQRP